MAIPLTDLLAKDTPFTWGEAQQSAFERIRDALVKATLLTFPDYTKAFHLHIDASLFAIGATVSQEDSQGQLRLLACMSKKLASAERNWPTHERELYAVISALVYWRHYLLGSSIIAHTDNSAVKWLTAASNLSARQARWLSRLQEYDLVFQHIPGVRNTAADALSRLKRRWKPQK